MEFPALHYMLKFWEQDSEHIYLYMNHECRPEWSGYRHRAMYDEAYRLAQIEYLASTDLR
jgi:hypothetical protein